MACLGPQSRGGIACQGVSPVQATRISFFSFPPEVREHIYKILLRSVNNRYHATEGDGGPYYHFDLRILRVSRLIRHEAIKVFQDNVFVKITTPWPETLLHVYSESSTAMVTTGLQASYFQSYHLRVYVDAPNLTPWSAATNEVYSMITCVEELDALTRLWHFSNLNGLRQINPHLRLRLDLQNPHVRHERIPKALQRRLILPFGNVKDLHSTEFNFHGKPFFGHAVDEDVRETVIRTQNLPTPTPEECIASALAHKEAGNQKMQAKGYNAALQEYFKAFEAIHIFIKGRKREIHCDNYYAHQLRSGVYQHLYGHYVRMMLRIQLVANTVFAYIKMENWEEAYFWGRRSVVLFRSTMTNSEEIGGPGWEEWVNESYALVFGGKEDMGKLFYRTALAARKIDRADYEYKKAMEIDSLIMAAGKYLGDDPLVQAEVNAMHIRQMARKGNENK
ncbi:MAG: hypothetical protein Q9163_004503 [Psora crenata]